MATKLKNLGITKVDFVDAGANPDANIKLFKRDSGKEQEPVGEGGTSLLKRLVSFLSKAKTDEDLEAALDEIEKSGSKTFGEQMDITANRHATDEIWDLCYALNNSLTSILWDDELDNEACEDAMKKSIEEFRQTILGALERWCSGYAAGVTITKREVPQTDECVAHMSYCMATLSEDIAKATNEVAPEKNEKKEGEPSEGDDDDMGKIDKSKLTPTERMLLEDLEKRYGAEESTTTSTTPAPAPAWPQVTSTDEAVAKALQDIGLTQRANVEGEDIYKGMSPAARAELEELRKYKQEAEDNSIREVAKKYTVLGKTEDEMFAVLKSLKTTNESAYKVMVETLDAQVAGIEKGLFSEIGKSNHGSGAATGAWERAEARAVELMKSRAGITKAQALDQVFLNDPELAAQCEKEE